MSEKTEQEILIFIIKEAIPKIRNQQNEFTPKYKKLIGFSLGYFLTDILKSTKDSKFRGKWIDDVEWKSLMLADKQHLKGDGFLWWGLRKDYSKLFSENFSAELTIDNFEGKTFSSYFLSFQIDGKHYEFKK